MTSYPHLFVGGVPCVGKTWLGSWLEEEGLYHHIDAEKDDGRHFDELGVHAEWDEIFRTGSADRFVRVLDELDRPVLVNWGFKPSSLPSIKALARSGIQPWWVDGQREQARAAFIKRSGVSVVPYFDQQMARIEASWDELRPVFSPQIVKGLDPDGNQRHPRELWQEISEELRSD